MNTVPQLPIEVSPETLAVLGKEIASLTAKLKKDHAAALVCLKDKDAGLLAVKESMPWIDEVDADSPAAKLYTTVEEALALTPSSDRLEAYVRERIVPSEQQIVSAAEVAGLLPNSIGTWMPAFHRFFDALYAPTLPAVSDGEEG